MKKNMILSFLLGAIIFGGIGSVVAYNYNAKDIGFTSTDENWNVNSVESALKSLKEVSKNYKKCVVGTKTITTSNYNVLEPSIDFVPTMFIVVSPYNGNWWHYYNKNVNSDHYSDGDSTYNLLSQYYDLDGKIAVKWGGGPYNVNYIFCG